MKRFSILLLFLVAVVAGKAQSATTTSNAQKAHTQAVRMQKVLTLSDDQTIKCESVILSKLDAADVITNNGSMSAPDQKAAIQKIQDEKDHEFAGILTPDQYALYLHKRAEAKARSESGNR